MIAFTHIYFHDIVAIKVALQNNLSQAELDEFIHEATLAKSLTHSRIVGIIDFGIQNNTPFLVMEYLPDGSLRDKHPAGTRVDFRTVGSYIPQIAEGLQFVHNQHIVHQDIKPENLMIKNGNEIILTDLGNALTLHTSVQKLQHIVGSPDYISPEQIKKTLTFQSDQYSLGVVIYELLAGKLPFIGQTPGEIMRMHLQDKPAIIPHIPWEINLVVQKALEKDPADRYASITEFAQAYVDAVEEVKKKAQQLAVPPPQKVVPPRQAVKQGYSLKAKVILTLSLVLMVIGVPAMLIGIRAQPTSVLQPDMSKPVLDIQADGAGLSPDGKYVASFSNVQNELSVHDIKTGKVIYSHVTSFSIGYNQDDNISWAWSPNSRYIAINIGNTTQVVNPFSNQVLLKYDVGGCTNCFVWSPHSNYLADYVGGDVSIRSIRSGEVVSDLKNVGSPIAWSPNGKYLLTDNGSETEIGETDIVEPFTGNIAYKTNLPDNFVAESWSPDSNLVLTHLNDDDEVIMWDYIHNKTFDYSVDQWGKFNSIQWSHSGKFIASASDDKTVKVWEPRGHVVLTYTSNRWWQLWNQVRVKRLAWSPNDSMIAEGGDYEDVYVFSVKDGETIHVFHSTNNTSTYVEWSSDGKYLLIEDGTELTIWNAPK